jgi:alpha-galactosidase
MRNALELAGRPILFSRCEWGKSKPRTRAAEAGRLGRTTTDIVDQWEDRRPRIGAGILTLAGMLEVGSGGRSTIQCRSHFRIKTGTAAAGPEILGYGIRTYPFRLPPYSRCNG